MLLISWLGFMFCLLLLEDGMMQVDIADSLLCKGCKPDNASLLTFLPLITVLLKAVRSLPDLTHCLLVLLHEEHFVL